MTHRRSDARLPDREAARPADELLPLAPDGRHPAPPRRHAAGARVPRAERRQRADRRSTQLVAALAPDARLQTGCSTLVFLATVPVYVGLMRFSSKRLRPMFDSLEEAFGRYDSHQIDAIKGIETVKALGGRDGVPQADARASSRASPTASSGPTSRSCPTRARSELVTLRLARPLPLRRRAPRSSTARSPSASSWRSTRWCAGERAAARSCSTLGRPPATRRSCSTA